MFFLLALSKQVYGYVTYNSKPLNMRVKGAVTLAITVTIDNLLASIGTSRFCDGRRQYDVG